MMQNKHENIVSHTLLFSVLAFSSCQSGKIEEEKQPNIIIILTDDQGYGDIGCHGNPDIITPNLDKLAAESVRLNRFYVSPVCAPTRASLMTGRYALRTGVYEVHNGGCIMDSEEYTIAELLNENGYKTAIYGKWHLGDNYPCRPGDQGFDEVFMHLAGGIGQPGDDPENYHDNKLPFEERKHSYFDPKIYHNGKMVDTRGYCTDVFTDKAVQYIENQKDTPFFIYLAYNAPHDPYQVSENYLKMYENLKIHPDNYGEKGQPFPEMDSIKPRGDFTDYENARRLYAMVTNIDDNVGRIRAKLEELDLEENTMLIFLGDNGPQWGRRYKAGLKGAKGSILEGGTRVPCFVYYPGKNWINKDVDVPFAHIDFLPTVADICGFEIPQRFQLDGISFRSAVEEGILPKERFIFNEYSSGFPQNSNKTFNISAISGDYKYLAYDRGGQEHEHQLYNIKDDPKELNNIASENKAMLNEFRQKTGIWFDDVVRELKSKQIYAIVGSQFQDTVILSRSEWKGELGRANKWDYQDAYGTWDIEFAREGDYRFILQQRERWPSKGFLHVELGDTVISPEINHLNLSEIAFTLKDVKPGKYVLFGVKCKTIIQGEYVSPDYVLVFKDSD